MANVDMFPRVNTTLLGTHQVSSKLPQSHRYECDLSARLFKSGWLYERQFRQHILTYAPDWPGMPVLLSPDIMEAVNRFSDGATVGGVLSSLAGHSGRSFAGWLGILNALVDRGFLRDAPDPKRFIPKGYQSSMRALNIWLHINNNCNLACSYCFVEHSNLRMEQETLDRTITQIGKTVRTHGVEDVLVKFAGGEPTLSLPQMEYFHEELSQELRDTRAYVHWTVLTNGTNLTERFLSFIGRAKATVSISIDGYGEYHDLYRVYRANPNSHREAKPKGSWDVINRNIETLRSKGISPYINAMVGPKTSPGLPKLAEWIFGNHMIGTIHVVRNVDDSWKPGESRRDQYFEYCEQLARDFESMFQELEHKKYRIELPRWMEIAELSFDQPAPDICCGIGSDHIVIKHDGSLASCPMTMHERTVAPINDLFAAARETFAVSPADRSPDDVCLHCQWFKVCASACPVANERIRGKAFTQSPLCKFWKYVIPRYLDFYGTKLLQAQELESFDLRNNPSAGTDYGVEKVLTN